MPTLVGGRAEVTWPVSATHQHGQRCKRHVDSRAIRFFMAADPRPTIAGGIAAAAITACLYAAHSAAFSSTLSWPSAPIYLHHQGAGTTLSFIPSTGLFIASNMSTPARFRLVDVSRALVRQLYEQQL